MDKIINTRIAKRKKRKALYISLQIIFVLIIISLAVYFNKEQFRTLSSVQETKKQKEAENEKIKAQKEEFDTNIRRFNDENDLQFIERHAKESAGKVRYGEVVYEFGDAE